MKIIASMICIFCIGCAGLANKNSSSTKSKLSEKKIEQRIKSREEQEQKIQDQKDLALVLQKKRKLGRGKVHPAYSKLEVIPSRPLRADLSEADLYGEIQARYERGDDLGFNKAYIVFMKNYPKSRFTDDVMYLKGTLEVYSKNYGSALRLFNQILKKYPKGNRAANTLFAKAMVLKKMNLPELAAENLSQLKKQYPKSIEASRAETELKLLRDQG